MFGETYNSESYRRLRAGSGSGAGGSANMSNMSGSSALVLWGARAASARAERGWVGWGAVLVILGASLLSPCADSEAPLLRWVEAVGASLAALALLTHAVRAVRARAPPGGRALSPRQLRLLGVRPEDIDSSFVSVSSLQSQSGSQSGSRSGSGCSANEWWWEEEYLSLCSPPPSPPSPSLAPPSPAGGDLSPEEMDFTQYYRVSGVGLGVSGSPPPPPYQLSAVEEEGAGEGAAGGGAGAGPDGALWRRLQIDPTRLTQFTLNLRVWLHLTVVSRVARELEAAGWGEGAGQGEPRLPLHLQPFLAPFPDRAYCARRVRALAAGGALSAYRWRAGGPDWAPGRPADAELLLQLLAAYLDSVLPGGGAAGGRPFSSRHLSHGAVPGRPPCLHLSRPQPPLVALVLGPGPQLEPPPGPNNLFHALLLFLAALARARPPCLQQVHLGPAGLNMLWIIGK